jgi:hypothetical protein
MQKELKKVDKNRRVQIIAEIQNTFNKKLEALNVAYKNKDGITIDNASKDLLTYLEKSLTKVHPVYKQMKNHTWERNHLMQKNNCMPSSTSIAIEAGLSEETVYKHLREFKEHDLYKHEADKYRLMIHRVLTTVFNLGVQGDIRACKVYLDYFTANMSGPAILPIKQTNYVQINNLKISATDLEQLPPATLQKIENLIKMPVKKKAQSN